MNTDVTVTAQSGPWPDRDPDFCYALHRFDEANRILHCACRLIEEPDEPALPIVSSNGVVCLRYGLVLLDHAYKDVQTALLTVWPAGGHA